MVIGHTRVMFNSLHTVQYMHFGDNNDHCDRAFCESYEVHVYVVEHMQAYMYTMVSRLFNCRSLIQLHAVFYRGMYYNHRAMYYNH